MSSEELKHASLLTLLIVEDHQVTRLGLSMLLGQVEGFQVAGEAADGAQAVEMALQLRPRIVVMDVSMPVMDGIAATRQIKSADESIRILVLTASDSEDHLFAALSAGADGYVRKESSNDMLVAAIKSVATGAAWLDPTIANAVLTKARGTATGAVELKSPGAAKENKTEFGLSPREQEVLELLVGGMSNQQMAEKLFVSQETVKTHMRHIMEKLTVSDRTQVAVKAMRHGLVND